MKWPENDSYLNPIENLPWKKKQKKKLAGDKVLTWKVDLSNVVRES